MTTDTATYTTTEISLAKRRRRGWRRAHPLRVCHPAALEQVWPATRHQRCTVHETVNVMDKMPKSVQPAAKTDLREVWAAPDRATAEAAVAAFADKYGAKYDKAVACLVKDRDALLAFYDFPAEHWDHLRTSNPIESVFATVRHRMVRYPGARCRKTPPG